jgi:hypothetical protein
MKGILEVDNYGHRGKVLFIRGHIDKDITKPYLMEQYFSKFTLKNMFFAQFGIDYCGG